MDGPLPKRLPQILRVSKQAQQMNERNVGNLCWEPTFVGCE